MSYLIYLFQPEDSTIGVTETIARSMPWSVRTAKTLLWIGVSLVMSMGISQLS